MTATSQAPTAQYRVVNPATGELVEEFATATDADIQNALSAAHGAYLEWRDWPIEERARIVARIGELFVERADELAAIVNEEMGKSRTSGRGEAEFAGSVFEYFATEGPALAADMPITAIGGKAVIQKRPVGALLGIMPWNYPFVLVARFAAPNLILGNTIVLKHAPNCPRSALAMEQIMRDSGLPRGAYVNVFATNAQVEDMIADPRIQGVSLTGSVRAGSAIAEIAGRHLKKTVLELGGSDPYVVLDSADVRASATAAWTTRMANVGQACNSNKRMIVMEDIFDEFVAEMAELAKALKPATPGVDASGTYAPMVSRQAAEELSAQVQDAVAKGATLHAGGQILDGPGAYFQPAVLTGVTPEMRAYHEELFGPIAVAYRVSSDQEALELANDTPYGLGGAVFSTDEQRAHRIAERLESGMAHVNSFAFEGPDVPFGGVKRSGFGRELGPLAMDEFVNKRLFYVAD